MFLLSSILVTISSSALPGSSKSSVILIGRASLSSLMIFLTIGSTAIMGLLFLLSSILVTISSSALSVVKLSGSSKSSVIIIGGTSISSLMIFLTNGSTAIMGLLF